MFQDFLILLFQWFISVILCKFVYIRRCKCLVENNNVIIFKREAEVGDRDVCAEKKTVRVAGERLILEFVGNLKPYSISEIK